jgi:hypothetical protein
MQKLSEWVVAKLESIGQKKEAGSKEETTDILWALTFFFLLLAFWLIDVFLEGIWCFLIDERTSRPPAPSFQELARQRLARRDL